MAIYISPALQEYLHAAATALAYENKPNKSAVVPKHVLRAIEVLKKDQDLLNSRRIL